MEGELYGAARRGDLSWLDQLPHQQHIESLSTAEENPLHIASWFGHVDFVEKILSHNPSLARGLNSQGLSPLHLASSKGHVEVAKALLKSYPDVCFFRDQKGRTPLHIAAEKGQVKVLKALVEAQPGAAWVMTDAGDPILHLCINHNQFEALKVLVNMDMPEAEKKLFINLNDDDGNTVLHLLASKGLWEVIRFLLRPYIKQLEINAVNNHGLTALDISKQYSFDDWQKTKKILLDAKAEERPYHTLGTIIDRERVRKKMELEKYRKWLDDTRETLMVVAILMATITFQAGLNPPGGVWQGDNSQNKNIRAGQAIMSYIAPTQYMAFIIFNSTGFVASLSLIVVLVGRFSFHQKVALWTIIVWIVVISILLIYTCSLSFLTSKNVSDNFRWSGGPISCGWGLILTGILLLVRFPAPVMFLYEIIGALIETLTESISERSWEPIKGFICFIYSEAWRHIKELICDKAWGSIKDLLGIRDTNAKSRGDA